MFLIFVLHWHIQGALDAGILVWAPKLRAQIKTKLIQENVNYLLEHSTQLLLHFHTFILSY